MATRIVGIDLGTSNCAVAFADPAEGPGAAIRDLPIPQLVRPGELAARALLPSFVYLPGPHEMPAGALALPWGEQVLAVGELARWQGANVPGRLISSAKSWLCHPRVDRQAAILPWGAGVEVPKLSPVDASALLLSHLAAAWQAGNPDLPLAHQEVVITVPASFDEAARALTVSAARKAGLEKFTLLEEPQAAFYDFTARHRASLAAALAQVRLVLVVDVGGGTTDFTLVHVEALPEGPALKRLAVGEHLMLGGDNMNAAVARAVEARLSAGGRKLSAAQWSQLVQGCRNAKEVLLSAEPPPRFAVSVVNPGSKLVGGALSAELTREEVESLLAAGFFPAIRPGEAPPLPARMALQELGLPYAQDPAITRHLAAFLRAHARAANAALGHADLEALPRPDAILLNGGVFNSPRLARALVDAVSAWWPDAPPIRLLEHDSLDLAVARGAAYYGLARRGLGRRIGGGAARAYYVGLSSEGEAPADVGGRAVCLIPRGFEEGESVDLTQRSFNLTLERPVQFQLFATTADRIDRPGDVVDLAGDHRPLPPIHAILRSTGQPRAQVPVHLGAQLTEIGTLALSCVANDSAERWRLEFELRGARGAGPLTVTESMPARFAEATEHLQRVFGHKPLPVGPKDVKNLSRTLEKTLGPRETWRLPVLRELWTALVAGAAKRRRSSDHERVFFQLLGFSLRPGFGYPLDDWRAEQTFRLFRESVTHHAEKPVWIEFWVLWRRVAGGLAEAAQQEIWSYLQPHLLRRLGPAATMPGGKPVPKPKGVQPEGLDEMVRAAASLEHLAPDQKLELGGWIAARLRDSRLSGGPWAWSLGRLGARVPLYGSAHKVVAPADAAEWVDTLLAVDIPKVDSAPFALAQLARLTGDRTRDLPEEVRARALGALERAGAPEAWRRMLLEVVTLSAADEARALGDTLPAGLSLD